MTSSPRCRNLSTHEPRCTQRRVAPGLLLAHPPAIHAQGGTWLRADVDVFVVYYQPHDLPIKERDELLRQLAQVREQVSTALELPPPAGPIPVYLIGSEGASGVTREGAIVLRRERFSSA